MKEEGELTVGQYLRHERERKNFSLDSISKITRISLRNLEALEKDEFQIFPAPIFTRGFLRTYAAQIGLDPQEVMSMFEAQTTSHEMAPKNKKEPLSSKIHPWLNFKYILILSLVVLGGGTSLFLFATRHSVPPSPAPSSTLLKQPALQTPSVIIPPAETLSARKKKTIKPSGGPKLDKDEGKPPASASVAALPAPAGEQKHERRHVLKVKATEKTWLQIQCDNQPAVEALLQPQQTGTWTARSQFNITVGNAGGVEISLNGVSQGPLGEPNQVVHLLLPKAKDSSGEEKEEP